MHQRGMTQVTALPPLDGGLPHVLTTDNKDHQNNCISPIQKMVSFHPRWILFASKLYL